MDNLSSLLDVTSISSPSHFNPLNHLQDMCQWSWVLYCKDKGHDLGFLGLAVKVLASTEKMHSSKNSKGSVTSVGSMATWLNILAVVGQHTIGE